MLDEFLRSARNLAHYLSLQRADLRQIQSAFRALGLSTLVLENLVREGMATRAETTDAAMAQRTECEMLNKGPHLVEAVSFLDQILRRMHRCQNKKLARLGPLKSWQGPKPL